MYFSRKDKSKRLIFEPPLWNYFYFLMKIFLNNHTSMKMHTITSPNNTIPTAPVAPTTTTVNTVNKTIINNKIINSIIFIILLELCIIFP